MKNKKNITAGIAALFLCGMLLTGCEREKETSFALTEMDDVMLTEMSDAPTAGQAEETPPIREETGEAESRRVVTVYVCGQVTTPGVYELPEDARVVDALMAAGGFTKAAAPHYLNQAERLSDGLMLYVPSRDELSEENGNAPDTLAAAAKTPSGEAAGNGLVNINAADMSELMTLSGVGEAKAEKIIAYRESAGGFQSIEDIMNVPGIKEGMFNKIKDQICVK